MNEWENDDSDILHALYNIYKKLGQFFLHTYLLPCLNTERNLCVYLATCLLKISRKHLKLGTTHVYRAGIKGL